MTLQHSTLGDRYEILGRLGRGGMGEVYLVRDLITEREVALKTLLTLGPEDLYRLKTEFRSLAGISHPNLVQLYDLVVTERTCFFTMEVVRGLDFVERFRGSSRTPGALRADAIGHLCDALEQLVEGLRELHTRGKLHRDVKPSNVLVTDDGRVVLLDFGLIGELEPRRQMESQQGIIAGTLAYMSPEQGWGRNLSAATDWYSVGVMLYETLTGVLPQEGSAPLWTSDRPCRSPSEIAPSIPEALDRLTMEMLAGDPHERPSLDRILSLLGRSSRPTFRTLTAGQLSSTSFVGRWTEKAALLAAFNAARSGRQITLLIHGVSGIGKTTLVEHSMNELEAQGVLVLRGRCHSQESIPFRGFDGVIDELSRFLMRSSKAELDTLLPPALTPLVAMFPVLRRIPAIAALASVSTSTDPQETRRLAFQALRQLVTRAARRSTVVIWIDDLQWGDLDSASLVRELLAEPRIPNLLLILSYRSEDAQSDVMLRAMALDPSDPAKGDASAEVLEIVLGPLDDDDCHLLVQRLLPDLLLSDDEGPDIRLQSLVGDSHGNPLFVEELARHVADSRLSNDENPSPRLRDVISGRIGKLPSTARNLLDLVAIAGRPVHEQILHRALQATGDVVHAMATLRNDCLVRTVLVDEQRSLCVYHDQIREAAYEILSSETRREGHRRLAEALAAQPSPDPLVLVDHYLGAGDAEQGGRHAFHAAELAAAGFAFNRAASLYRCALELGTGICPGWVLRAKLGEALVNAGRGADGAQLYVEAASELARTAPSHKEILDLRRRAAEQFMRSGLADRGLEILRSVLEQVDVRYPESSIGALISLLSRRARLRVKRARTPMPPEQNVSPRERQRLEACWSAGLGLSLFDPWRAACFQAEHALLAHRAGSRPHIIRSLATESLLLAWEGSRRSARRAVHLQAISERLARELDDPNVEAHSIVMRAAAALFRRRSREALSLCELGEVVCRERCNGAAWELANLHHIAGNALATLGEISALRKRQVALIAEAEERGDQYGLMLLRCGLINVGWLGADRPDEARRQAEAGMIRAEGSTLGAYQGTYGLVLIDLYLGDGIAGLERLDRARPVLRRSLLNRFQSVRIEISHLRGSCSLMAAVGSRNARERAGFLAAASAEVSRLRAERTPFADSLRETLVGGIAVLSGNRTTAASALERAAAGFDRDEMHLYAAATRFQLGKCLGTSGRELVRRNDDWMRSHGIDSPERLAGSFVPWPDCPS